MPVWRRSWRSVFCATSVAASREREDDRRGALGLDLLDRLVELGVDEALLAERMVFLEDPLEGEDDRAGIEVGSVVELDALRELERPRLPVRRLLPLLGERGL